MNHQKWWCNAVLQSSQGEGSKFFIAATGEPRFPSFLLLQGQSWSPWKSSPEVTKSSHSYPFFRRRDEEDNSRCSVCCIQQVLCPLKCKRLGRSNQLTCLPVIWECVSDMGFAQMPCAPESLPPVETPSLHPCAKSSPLWAWQRTCIFLVTCLQELRKASSVCSVISPNFPRPAA